MALRWDEARLVVTCGEAPSEEERAEWPDDVILCALRPEEVDDPETVRTVREFVLERTLQARRDGIEELLDPDARIPEPDATEPVEGADSEAARREDLLLERLLEAPADGIGDDGWYPPADGAAGRGMWLGDAAGTGARFYIGRVDELVVHN